MSAYETLGLAPGTTDPAAIRRAYAVKLREHRPDVDPAGFARIRAAKDFLLGKGTDDPESPLDDAWHEPASPPPETDVERRVVAVSEWEVRLAAALRGDSQDERIALARELMASPARVAEISHANDVVRLAEEIAFDAPMLAKELGAAWWAVARSDERRHVSLGEVDRRRAITSIAASYPKAARHAVYAMALGTPSTDPRLAQGVLELERAFRGKPERDPLFPWLKESCPSDPLTRRLSRYRRTHGTTLDAEAAQDVVAFIRRRSRVTTRLVVIVWTVALFLLIALLILRLGEKPPPPPPSFDVPPSRLPEIDRFRGATRTR